jgi:transcriptional regulator GlxA family with amidase domain
MSADSAHLHFLLLPDFPLYALVPATDALRIANQTAGTRLFDWSFVSAKGGPVRANNGMVVDETLPIGGTPPPRCVIVCSGNEPVQHLTKPMLSWLRRLAAHGVMLGALDTGAFALAAAGVLAGYKATLHWEAIPVFRDAFPDIEVLEQIFVVDRERATAAGGIASLDMMLWMIDRAHGPALAQTVANGFVHGRARPPETPQRMDGVQAPSTPTQVRRCMTLMRENLAFPLPAEDLCQRLSISRRRLERLFRRETGLSPSEAYMALRLEAAREQLFYSGNSIGHIAEACGFVSNAHFSRAFRRRFGSSPTAMRQSFASAERGKFHPVGLVLSSGSGAVAEPAGP